MTIALSSWILAEIVVSTRLTMIGVGKNKPRQARSWRGLFIVFHTETNRSFIVVIVIDVIIIIIVVV